MADYQTIDISRIQPSQFYVSEEKLQAIETWFDPANLSNFDPIPVKKLDGELVSTDGHTRCVAALLAGLTAVPFVWEQDELNWEMYRRCVAACKEKGILCMVDLQSRIIPASEYEVKWNQWCDVMQAEVIKISAEQD